MKTLSKIFFVLLSFSFLGFPQSEETIKEVTFDTSIHCDGCVEKVYDNLSFEDGVVDLDVNLEEKTVRVIYNSQQTNTDNLTEALKNLGYKAVIIDENEVDDEEES